MPLGVDIGAALFAGLTAFLVGVWYAASSSVPARPALEPARALGEALRTHQWVRRLVVARLDRSVATGFLLTATLACALAGGVVLGVLAYLIRAVPVLQRVDNWVAGWGFDHRSHPSTRGLQLITDLGGFDVVVALVLLLVVTDLVRHRDPWVPAFLLAVLGGKELLTLGVKDLTGRVRPSLDPLAATLGPSFPSGHSATAAAFYAAAALVLGRRLQSRARQVLAGLAVAIAVAVALSRVLLDLHWLSDVAGGLALGWGWFGLCAIVFGGRLLRPAAAVETAAATAAPTGRAVATPPAR